MTHHGPTIILPIEYLNDIKDNEQLTLVGFAKRDYFATYPGMHIFIGDPVFAAVVRQKLTQALGGLTVTLWKEACAVFKEHLGRADGKYTFRNARGSG